jgi:putative oxidoreductase
MMQPNTWTAFITNLLILLFTYTSLSKLLDFTEFSSQMHNQPVPIWMADLATWTLPSLQLIIVGLLSIQKFRWWGFLLAFIVMSILTLYIILIVTDTFPYIPCSCAGILKGMSWSTQLVFNIVITIIAFIGFRSQRRIDSSTTHQNIPR